MGQWEEEENRELFNGFRVSVWVNEKVLEVDGSYTTFIMLCNYGMSLNLKYG